MTTDYPNHSPLRRLKTKRIASLYGCRLSTLATVFSFALGFSNGSAQVASSPLQQAAKLHQAGLAQVRSGQLDEAIATFKEALELTPQDATLLDATGAAYTLTGDLESAKRFFLTSLRIDPNSVPTKQNLGIALFSTGQYEEAAKQFRDLQSAPGKPRMIANLFLGLIAQRQSNCKLALPLIEASASLMYQYPDALLSFSECEYQIHNARRAEEGLAAFDRLAGNTPSQYLQAADLHSRVGQNEKALEDLNLVQSTANHPPAISLRRAILLEKIGRVEEAQRILEDLASSQPTFESLFLLAKVTKERGDFAVALKSLKRAAQIEPGREDAYLEFSAICADHGNDQLALDSAEIGLDHVPDSYRLTVQKGVVQEKLGYLSDAEETLKKAIGMQKDNSDALLSLAVVQAHSGRPDVAEQTLEGAIRQYPDNYYMYYFEAKVLLQFTNTSTGRADLHQSARRSLEKSIALNPEYADSYYLLSDVYMANSPRLAEQALHKCLQLDPNHVPAQYSLARLYVRTRRKAEGEELLARLKTQQRAEELQQQKQLRIEVATN